MGKLFKLLSNVSKIFKYLDIFSHVSNGLRIAIIAIETTIKELKETKPDFKYLATLESVLSFVQTVKEAVDTFIGIFGIVAVQADIASLPKEDEKKDLLSEELKWIESEIKKEL